MRLNSPHDVAETVERALHCRVRYQDVSTRMFTKVARAMGFAPWTIAQFRHYAEELRAGAYAVGAPTDHVEQVCGRPAEDFDVTAQRYVEHPEYVWSGFKTGGKLGAMSMLLKAMLTKVPDLDGWESVRGRPRLQDSQLAHENDEWLATAEQQDLNLLPVGSRRKSAAILNGAV